MTQDRFLQDYFEVKAQVRLQLAQSRKWRDMPRLLDQLESLRNARSSPQPTRGHEAVRLRPAA